MNFGDRLAARVRAVGSPICVGIDPHLERVPGITDGMSATTAAAVVEAFCVGVVHAVCDVAAAVKPQVAFFEQLGSAGVAALERTVAAAREAGLVVVLDAKRNDIGSTAEAYARATLDDDGPLGADAVTLSPYLGPESLHPFLSRTNAGKGVFVLVRTSNPGAGPWQRHTGIAGHVADFIRQANAGDPRMGSVGAVVGATFGAESAEWRARMPNAWLLVPGLGAQGAQPRDVLPHFRADGLGALVTSSRGVLFGASGREGTEWPGAVRERAQRLAESVRRVRTVG